MFARFGPRGTVYKSARDGSEEIIATMKRVTLYSRSGRSGTDRAAREHAQLPSQTAPVDPAPASAPKRSWRALYARHRGALLFVAGGVFAVLLVLAHGAYAPAVRPLTQEDINAAVRHTLENEPLPSRGAKAYQVIRPSVVRVRGLGHGEDPDGPSETSVGSGVVIVDTGIILTSLHVVAGAERVSVVFADGHESDAAVVGARPEHDLAVLRARSLPDDIVPATLRSTQGLAPGDDVIAVGFPFGIGPSVSSGVISGLRREYYSHHGERKLSNLIQFDAAVNPGSSGGPLVTAQGEVVGIVTSILNPTERSFFVGIGFAVPIENAASAAGIPPF